MESLIYATGRFIGYVDQNKTAFNDGEKDAGWPLIYWSFFERFSCLYSLYHITCQLCGSSLAREITDGLF